MVKKATPAQKRIFQGTRIDLKAFSLAPEVSSIGKNQNKSLKAGGGEQKKQRPLPPRALSLFWVSVVFCASASARSQKPAHADVAARAQLLI